MIIFSVISRNEKRFHSTGEQCQVINNNSKAKGNTFYVYSNTNRTCHIQLGSDPSTVCSYQQSKYCLQCS